MMGILINGGIRFVPGGPCDLKEILGEMAGATREKVAGTAA